MQNEMRRTGLCSTAYRMNRASVILPDSGISIFPISRSLPMRRWLHNQYHTLAALNQEWGTNYKSWDLVTPPTTHDAMQRKDDNFASWADFKEWMDISFANALEMGTKAIHEVDPNAYVGVGGGQMPGWGGYDYARLTHALTAIEPYDIGDNIEIIRSLNPNMPMVTTGFANGKQEQASCLVRATAQ